MIRKGIVFLLLVGVGLLVLNLMVGGEDFAGSAGRTTPAAEELPSVARGVQIAPGEQDPETFSVTVGGRMSIPRSKTVNVGAGTRELRVYLLECEDSEPISDEVLRMQNVSVDFFEVGGTDEDPRAVLAGRMVAREAFVQLGVDERGRTSVNEDKEMRVRGAVLHTTDRARAPNISLTLDEALALITEDGVHMYTPDDLLPFRLESTGDEPWEITGNGLETWLPRQGGLPGDQIRIDVHRNPELTQTTAGGVTHLAARGMLSYREDPRDGAAVILMEEDVRIELEEGALVDSDDSGTAGSMTASGQRLRAHLARRDTGGGQERLWQRIQLDGDPASLAGNGAVLSCTSLSITPGPGGQPYLVSATGAPAVMDYVDAAGSMTRVEASRRIHLVRPWNQLGDLFTGFGFPSWSLGPLERTEIVVFEGAARMDRGSELILKASEGMWVARSLPSGKPMAMHGRGDVEVIQAGEGPELHVSGNQGFDLTFAGEDTQHIRVGPETVQEDHRYTVQRGELDLRGVGVCEITQSPDSVTVRLRAPGPQIHARFGDRGSLEELQDLDASIAGGELESFLATGPVCRILWGEVQGSAQEIESLDPSSFRLSGTVTSPAQAHYRPPQTSEGAASMKARDVRLWGEEIRIHRVSGDDVLIDASAPEPSVARLRLEVLQGTEPPMSVVLHGRRIRWLPWAVSPAALDAMSLALPPGTRQLFARNQRSPYLFAEQEVRITQTENATEQRGMDALGDFLLLGLDSRNGYLTGRPATLRRTDGEQTVTGIANRVNLHSGPDGELLELVATDGLRPELQLVDPSGSLQSESGEPSRLRVVGTGDVRVLSETVDFEGPVEMQSVTAEGGEDPEGPSLEADHLSMDRDRDSGEILQVHASGHVHMVWRKVVARGTILTLDPVTRMVEVSDPSGDAVVELPSGLRHSGAELRANYETLRVQSWDGRVDGGRRGR